MVVSKCALSFTHPTHSEQNIGFIREGKDGQSLFHSDEVLHLKLLQKSLTQVKKGTGGRAV